MSVDTLPYSSLLGLARVLDDWLEAQGWGGDPECDGDHTPNAADADDLIRRLAADGFLVIGLPA